ncbi:MAG: putative signal transduction protein with EAL and GGDEF domain [Moritella dasanensis]|jgi:predicted signal transduction protein with EAL and GGDEF domain
MKDLSLGKLSVSIGISTYPINGMQKDELTKLSDVALYEAKERGRNQSCHYSDLIIMGDDLDLKTVKPTEKVIKQDDKNLETHVIDI